MGLSSEVSSKDYYEHELSATKISKILKKMAKSAKNCVYNEFISQTS